MWLSSFLTPTHTGSSSTGTRGVFYVREASDGEAGLIANQEGPLFLVAPDFVGQLLEGRVEAVLPLIVSFAGQQDLLGRAFLGETNFTVTLGRFANDGCSTVEPSPSGSAHWDVSTLMPGAELLEYICQENNQDLQKLEGPARGPGGQ